MTSSMLSLQVVTILVCSAQVSADPCTFKRGADMVTARRNHGAGALNTSWGTRIYACGGITDSNTCDVFDGLTWTKHPATMNEGRYKASNMVLWHDKLVICGGGGDHPTTNTCDTFDGTSWTLLPEPMKVIRSQSVLAVFAGHLIICGGASKSCEYFDGAKWTMLPVEMPSANGALSGGVIGNELYVCGYGATCDIYDGIEFRTVPLPKIAGYSSTAVFDNALWFCGPDDTCMVTRNGTFSTHPSKLLNTHNEDTAAAVGADGVLYVTGGDYGQSTSWQAEKIVQVCSPPTMVQV